MTFGIMTFGIITFGIMTFGIMTFGIMTFGIMTFGIMTFGIMTFGIMMLKKEDFFNCPNFGKSSQSSCQAKKAKIPTLKLNLKFQNIYIKPLVKP